MATRNRPKRDGSGRGVGANRGRGGCANPSGRNRRSSRRPRRR